MLRKLSKSGAKPLIYKNPLFKNLGALVFCVALKTNDLYFYFTMNKVTSIFSRGYIRWNQKIYFPVLIFRETLFWLYAHR